MLLTTRATLVMSEFPCGKNFAECDLSLAQTQCSEQVKLALSRAQVFASYEREFFTEMLGLESIITYSGKSECLTRHAGLKPECDVTYFLRCSLSATMVDSQYQIQHLKWSRRGTAQICSQERDQQLNDASHLAVVTHTPCSGEKLKIIKK
jgi:hypothetical protein